MLYHHLKIAWRRVIRQTGFSALNLLGLAVGLAATFLTLTYVYYQCSFDRFHTFADRLCRTSAIHHLGEAQFHTRHFNAGFGPAIQDIGLVFYEYLARRFCFSD